MPFRSFLALAVTAVFAGSAAQAQTIFQFDGNINAQSGPGTLAFRGTSAGVVAFNTASGFGIPALPGGNAQVMSFPAFTPAQGLLFQAGVGPNGGSTLYINRHTFGFDLLVPTINWTPFFNTEGNNTNDADFYINPTGGIGIDGVYSGTIAANTWNRIVVTIDGPTSTMSKYINGTPVGTQTLSSGFDGRWTLYSNLQTDGTALFTESAGGFTNAGYINSLFFQDRVLSAAEIAAFAGPTATGFTPVAIPEPSALALVGLAAAGWAWRRRRTNQT